MRMSCNGCRVLRKGCTDDCTIRPCLQWITSPESQANATVFLAKFYGRAGLLNLINAGAEHLRPAIFRSLLYEACGRIMNPVYGSVGLLWSGNWPLCQNAVEAVLRGEPITQLVTTDTAEANNGPPLQAYDIRHVPKDDSNDLHRVRNRSKFKRTAAAAGKELNVSVSHDSGLSHQSEAVINGEGESQGTTDHTLLTAEGPALLRAKAEPVWLAPKDYNNGGAGAGDNEELELELELELTLGVKRGKSV